MEISVHENSKIVEVWLTNSEQSDNAVTSQLTSLYAKYSPQKYTVAVFKSGSRDLYHSTLDLLSYNKKRAAELYVRSEKQRHDRA